MGDRVSLERHPSRRGSPLLRVKLSGLRHELVAAGLGDQQLGLGRILLDLLPQPIDMRLQSMRGDAGVVAPDLMQQHVAGHDPLTGAIEIFEDRGFLLGQPDLAAAAIDQQFGRRLEGVRSDGEDRILALLVLPELRADAREQHAELEGLGDIIVGAGFKAEDGVGIGGLSREHDDRTLEPAAAKELARLAAVEIGEADIEQHEIDMTVPRKLEPVRRVGGEHRVELLVQGKLLAQGVAELVIVVDDQDLARIAHWPPPTELRGIQ